MRPRGAGLGWLELIKRPVRPVRAHARIIHRDIIAEPLNRGRRLSLLMNYARWHLSHKYAGRQWGITFDNGMKSIVYPYPDHDAGEVNIWTINVDYHDIQLVRSVIQQGDFIVDAGCNVGNRTIAVADKLSGALLIDAGRRAVERTRENLTLNNLPLDKFIVCHAAVGDRQGSVVFSDLGGASTLNRVIDGSSDVSAPTIEVRLTTIDDELARIGKSPSFIKVDVEGYDYLALRGCLKTLRSGSVRLVKFERNASELLEPLEQLFHEIGWTVFALDKSGRISTSRQLIERNMNLFAAPALAIRDLTARHHR